MKGLRDEGMKGLRDATTLMVGPASLSLGRLAELRRVFKVCRFRDEGIRGLRKLEMFCKFC